MIFEKGKTTLFEELKKDRTINRIKEIYLISLEILLT